METLIAVLVGILFAVGTYLILTRQMVRVILGISLLGHAVNLLILATGGLKKGRPPLLSENGAAFADALPQALILTAIVINFAVTAFLLVLSYRTYQKYGTDSLDDLRGNDDE